MFIPFHNNKIFNIYTSYRVYTRDFWKAVKMLRE